MMGLPAGYCSKPLQILFHELTTNAILEPERNADGKKTYRDFLPKQYWHLRKKIKLQHYAKPGEVPYFEIGIATPQESRQKLAFFKAEQYGKHLIGNGWSIPVIEYLLEGIVDLFAPGDLRMYEGYECTFPWEPYLSSRRRQK